MKTSFKVYLPLGDGIGWCEGTYDTLAKAKRAADKQPGRAWVTKVVSEVVYRNGKSAPGDGTLVAGLVR